MDEQGTPYVLEINSAPSLPYPYRQSCVAKAFDWMLDNREFNLNPFTRQPAGDDWKNYIHPAIRG